MSETDAVRYRPDIDGLRAIAVLSVIAYHLDHRLLAGGFLGVDVFFVLSGYLITAIIWREAQQGQFTLRRFYERRVRRIAPALLLMIAVVTAVSAIVLMPVDLVGFGKSVLATLGFVANIYFWRDTNYFAADASLKPLLHMWSLGVEEQFYLLFPLLLAFLARVGRGAALPLVVALTIGSFALDVYLARRGFPNVGFYLLPSRAWELGAGAALSLRREARAPRWATPIAGLALAMLLFALARGEAPGWDIPKALPAVLGTTILVWAGGARRPAVSRLIGARPIAAVGLISYSLYLWHWPIIVLVGYVLVDPPGPLILTVLLIATASCGWLSWRFVERPFRTAAMPRGRMIIILGSATAALAAAGVLLIVGNGFPQRLAPAVARLGAAADHQYRCPISANLSVANARGCAIALSGGRPEDADVVLLGNSHAMMYAPLVADVLRQQHRRGILLFVYRCPPFTGMNIDRDCNRQVDDIVAAALSLKRARQVILAGNWGNPDRFVRADGTLYPGDSVAALTEGLDATIDRLVAGGKRVTLVGPIDEPGWDVPSVASRRIAFGLSPAPLRAPYGKFLAKFGQAIDHFAARRDIGFIRPDRIQCRQESCDFARNGRSLFGDGNHLAQEALPPYRPLFAHALALGR